MVQTFYSQQLKNPLWQKRRLEVFNRDHFTCTNCHASNKELQVHHLDYISGILPWEYPLDMLTTLCVDCHNSENNRERHETYLLNSLKMKGFLVGDIIRLSTKIDIDKSFTNFLLGLLRKGL